MGSTPAWGEGGLTAHGSRLTAHGYRRLGGGGCGGEWAASFGIGDDVVYAAAAAGKKHGVSLRLPQRRSPRSSTDLGKTPSSRGKINLFLRNSVNVSIERVSIPWASQTTCAMAR